MREFNPFPLTNNGKPDLRYRIGLEHTGHEKPHFVLRFCDEFVASSISYSAMVGRAIGLRAIHRGAVPIVEIPA
jgi:hypothetical protein